jgi:hypothetical protein
LTVTPPVPSNFSPRTPKFVRARGEKFFVISHFIQAGTDDGSRLIERWGRSGLSY